MKCQELFSGGKKKKNLLSLLSAKFAQRVAKVKVQNKIVSDDSLNDFFFWENKNLTFHMNHLQAASLSVQILKPLSGDSYKAI